VIIRLANATKAKLGTALSVGQLRSYVDAEDAVPESRVSSLIPEFAPVTLVSVTCCDHRAGACPAGHQPQIPAPPFPVSSVQLRVASEDAVLVEGDAPVGLEVGGDIGPSGDALVQ
jgi:hypothetical protein